ncbi:MAG: hypothetical protein IKI64_09845 [Clostridia bacterium]|nr:hypothetical protein [Clostridia bacterium]
MRGNGLFDFSNKGRVIRTVLSHITMLLAVLVLVLFVIDRVNNAMEFMTSQLSRWTIAALAFFALITAVLNIFALWDNPDKRRRRRDRSSRS